MVALWCGVPCSETQAPEPALTVSALTVYKLSTSVEQRGLNFHSVTGLADYVTSPALELDAGLSPTIKTDISFYAL